MVDIEDSHIGTPPHTTLLDDIGSGVKGSHKRYRAAGNPTGGTDPVFLRSETGKREAGTATTFVN